MRKASLVPVSAQKLILAYRHSCVHSEAISQHISLSLTRYASEFPKPSLSTHKRRVIKQFIRAMCVYGVFIMQFVVRGMAQGVTIADFFPR